ncbi:MAG: hypothetical protein KDH95_18920 [Calditrichaeota bacterium]|nr:hypothetical protein [Calditrichota bacterium]MCB0270236.1 hypothetical protein [Calditrichota bacterium]
MIKTVVDGDYNADSHGVEWNGTNDNGQPVTSGMYFYRLTATGGGTPFVQTRKMMLMK